MYWSIGEGLLEYWCRVVLALLYFQDYLFSDVLTLFQQTQPYGYRKIDSSKISPIVWSCFFRCVMSPIFMNLHSASHNTKFKKKLKKH